MDSPDCLLLLLSIFRRLLFSFFLFLHFLIAGSVRWIKLTHVGFRAHVKISYRIKWSKTAISANVLCWLQCRLEVSGAIPSLQCQSLADQDRLTG